MLHVKDIRILNKTITVRYARSEKQNYWLAAWCWILLLSELRARW